MGLSLALTNALSGLQAAQANLSLISANIANAQTPGYSRETLPQLTQVLGTQGDGGVLTGLPQRVSNQVLTANLRSQSSVTSAASTLDSYFQRIQDMFGTVGGATSLSDTLGAFSSALQTLATTPEDPVAQANAVNAGQDLTTQLNSMSAGVQTLRTNADTDIGTAVSTVNTLLGNIASYNLAFVRAQANGQPTATIADQRDQALLQLSQQMNIQSFTRSDGTVVVMTGGGTTLADTTAQTVSFTPTGTASATSPLSKITVNGADITGSIQGGTIGALVQMRDKELPALTSELNQFANQLYNTAQVTQSTQLVTVGSAAATGDTFQVTIDGQVFNTAATAGATVTDIVNSINGQLGATTFSASVSGGNILITDSAGNPLTASIVQTAGTGTATFTPNAPANALPTTNSGTSGAAPGDANHFFAGVNTATGVDNAGTITINPSLLNNPGLLNGVAGVPSQTIATALADAIAMGTSTFAAAGNFTAPVTGTLASYAGQILGQSATAASAASANDTFQTGVQNDVSTRAVNVTGVNMDEELGNLQIYQTAYAASARVMDVIQSMFTALMQIQTS